MSCFERMEERRRRLRNHGFEGEPSGEQLVDYALSLEDRLNAVCAATGLRLRQDARGRWFAAAEQEGSGRWPR